MERLRVREVAERRGFNLNQLYTTLNTARAQRGEKFVAMGTMRRYWHSTANGRLDSDNLDQVSLSFLREVARTLGVSVCDLLPAEDSPGQQKPRPRATLHSFA